MNAGDELSVEVTPRPSDIYSPFDYSAPNVLAWAMVVFAGLLAYETRPIWSSGPLGNETTAALMVVGLMLGLVFVVLFLFPYIRILSALRDASRRLPRRVSFTRDL